MVIFITKTYAIIKRLIAGKANYSLLIVNLDCFISIVNKITKSCINILTKNLHNVYIDSFN
ncbi:hypothetical protein CAXC1_300008 [Candidatus Xenohaliotis californiensis]|uniref:Uncharacterized protein n=1 Tax=Candidatus Xenohaliotis californiensis TaxID=84677 RepID=A0ABP0ESX5_9RICK|nr:hypothetical protein CAXC1_300008 [Candidatus Xenohaliotis californiensis]